MVAKWREEVADGCRRGCSRDQAPDHEEKPSAHQIESLPAKEHDARFLTESARHNTSGLPSQGSSGMPLDHTLSGRMARRLPIVVVVHLAQAECASTDGGERTYTDNISSRGARVYSTRPWQLGDAVQVTPRNEAPASGKVVYCQMLPYG